MSRTGLLNTMEKRATWNRRNCIKCWKNTSLPHFLVMCQVAWKYINSGWDVYSEVIFTKGGRADLVALNGNTGVIIEVLHSEKEMNLADKKARYPDGFIFTHVNTKDFNIEDFDV